MRRPPFDPPYVPGTEPAPYRGRGYAILLGALAGLVLTGLVWLLLQVDNATPEPAEVVTPSPYGYPPALALVALWPWRRLAAAVNRAVYDPNPDGRRCHYCTRDARLAFRANTSAPALWQLLAIRGFFACWSHWPYAAGDAHRSVKRECLTGLAETGRE